MDDRLIDLLRRAEDLKKGLDSLRPLDKEREAIVMQKLRLDWNYHSNHLEGNSLTFGETKALILFGITAQGKPLKDHVEITGHDEAIKWIEDVIHKKEPLTENFIRQIHELLLKEPYEVDAITPDGQPTRKKISVGNYKSTPNHVKTKTGEIFRFATPEETLAKMHDLIAKYRVESEKKDKNPILLAAEFHYDFIRIHPFDDGNGRMARILMNFILMQYGYPPVIVKTGEKEKYIAALQQADAGIFDPFFEFIINNEIRSLEIMLAGARGESVEEPDDLDKELALLEQRLKGKGTKITKYKNENTLREFGDLLELFLKYIELYINRFKKFYLKTDVILERTDDFLVVNQFGDRIKSNPVLRLNYVNHKWDIKPDDHKLFFRVSFLSLSYKGYENIEFESIFDITLEETEYTIANNSNKETIGHSYTKLYSEKITPEEFHNLIKHEEKRHKHFLDEISLK